MQPIHAFGCGVIIESLLLLLFTIAAVAGPGDGAPYASIAAIHALEADEASEHHPVQVTGTLSFVNRAGFATYGFVQDGDEAIYIELAPDSAVPEPGSRVRVQGRTMPGEFASSIGGARLTRLGEAAPLDPVRPTTASLLTGRFDSRWVSAEGVVRWVDHDAGSNLWVLGLDGPVQVELPGRLPPEAPARLIGARITAEGACGARFNGLRQLVGVRVLSPGLDQVRVVEAAPADRSRLAVTPVRDLLAFDPDRRADGLVRTRGQVVAVLDDRVVVQQDGAGTLVRTAVGERPPPIGSRVDLTGYVRPDGLMPLMEDARVLEVGATIPLPEPRPRAGLDGTTEPLTLSSLTGEVAQVVVGPRGADLLLDVGASTARVVIAAGPLAAGIEPRARIRVTGVPVFVPDLASRGRRVAADRYALAPRSVQLVVPEASTVQVLTPAPFWTAARTWVLLGAVGGCLVIAGGWALVLRHQVRRKTAVIQEQLEQQAALREAAQAASEAKGRFLATMSHELRTPLHGILGATALLRGRGGLHDDDRELISVIGRSGEQLRRLVGDVLDLTRAEEGRLSLELEPTDLRSLVQECAEAIRPMVGDRPVQVIASSDAAVPPFVQVDPLRVRQIVLNLAGNAVKFTESGRVEIRVEAVGESHVLLTIADTGPGIGAEVLDHLFEPFQQGDSGTRRRWEGSGLGLSIVHQLVQRMDGQITVASMPGAGTTFTVRLPAPASLTDPDSLSEGDCEVTLGDLRILVADDNPVNRMIVERMLRGMGVVVRLAEDGDQAIRSVLSEPVDVVLMDLHMPGLDGLEATRSLVQTLGEACPPVIALTADALVETRQRCLQAGMVDVLTKPIAIERLQTVLARHTSAGPPGRARSA